MPDFRLLSGALRLMWDGYRFRTPMFAMTPMKLRVPVDSRAPESNN